MKMHFRQLLRPAVKAASPDKEIPSTPAWVPPPWMIPLIDKDERKRNEQPGRDERPRQEIHIDDGEPPRKQPPAEDSDQNEDGNAERGVIVIDLWAK